MCSKHGEVVSLNIVMDHGTKKSKEFGFVKYAEPDMAEQAVSQMNNMSLRDKTLRVELSKRSRGRSGRFEDDHRGPRDRSFRRDERGFRDSYRDR